MSSAPPSVDRVLDRLERVRRSGEGWLACCPAHDDREPSLSVAIGDDGRVLLTCFAGCSPEEILAKLGLEWADLFADNGARPPGEPEGVYRYCDEYGAPLFEVGRFAGKKFLQRRAGATDWRGGIKGVRRVLYRSDRLFASIEQAAEGEPPTVYVAEGEKDVHALERAGALATTSPMGAGKWRPEYAEQLRGCDVVLIADRDEPGREHAGTVARSLEGIAASVRVVEAKSGKDAADHLSASHALEELVDVELDDAPDAAGDGRAPFVGRSHTEVLALELPPERYLVADLIPIGAVGTIAGVPETHKSWLAQAIAVRVARGEGEILGCEVASSGPVGYFWEDDSTREEAERVKLFESVDASPKDLPLTWYLNEGLRLPADFGRLRATVEQCGLVLVILDSFYNVAAVDDLKDAGPERLVAQLKREVADPTGTTVLIVDHMPWATDSDPGRLRAYGGVFKGAATRFGIYVDAEGKKLWIEARGNNVRGFRRTPAYWDADALELKLVDTTAQEEDEEDLDRRVYEFVDGHPGSSQSKVRGGVSGATKASIRASNG